MGIKTHFIPYVINHDLTINGDFVISGTFVSKTPSLIVGIGSPTNWNGVLQTGSNITNAGSNVWITFGTAFAEKPYIQANNKDGFGGLVSINGSINAGSFFTISENADTNFDWIAIGSINV